MVWECCEQDSLLDVAGDSTAIEPVKHPTSSFGISYFSHNHCHSGHFCLSDSKSLVQSDNPVSLNNSKIKIIPVAACLSPELTKPAISAIPCFNPHSTLADFTVPFAASLSPYYISECHCLTGECVSIIHAQPPHERESEKLK
jgi:hypothetical protein